MATAWDTGSGTLFRRPSRKGRQGIGPPCLRRQRPRQPVSQIEHDGPNSDGPFSGGDFHQWRFAEAFLSFGLLNRRKRFLFLNVFDDIPTYSQVLSKRS